VSSVPSVANSIDYLIFFVILSALRGEKTVLISVNQCLIKIKATFRHGDTRAIGGPPVEMT